MDRRNLEKHLRCYGCFLHHHGGNHDIWLNPRNLKQAPMPRHRKIKRGTARGICRILEIPKPPGL
jgi:hypothetical protein